MCWLAATISLNVSATLPASPTHVPGNRTVKSPSRMLWRLARITERSTGSSAVFVFPFVREAGARFSLAFCIGSFSADRFIFSPTQEPAAVTLIARRRRAGVLGSRNESYGLTDRSSNGRNIVENGNLKQTARMRHHPRMLRMLVVLEQKRYLEALRYFL